MSWLRTFKACDVFAEITCPTVACVIPAALCIGHGRRACGDVRCLLHPVSERSRQVGYACLALPKTSISIEVPVRPHVERVTCHDGMPRRQAASEGYEGINKWSQERDDPQAFGHQAWTVDSIKNVL